MATNISETVKRISDFNTALKSEGCVSPLDSELESVMLAKALSSGTGQRCYKIASGGFVIKMGLGNYQFCLGFAEPDRQLDALRYADLALRVFWKYKKRDGHPPKPSELNGTLDQLHRDYCFEQHLVAALRRIEMILLQDGVISSDVAKLNVAMTQQGKSKSEAQLELARKQMEDECKLDDRFRAINDKIKSLEITISQMAEILKRHVEFDNNQNTSEPTS